MRMRVARLSFQSSSYRPIADFSQRKCFNNIRPLHIQAIPSSTNPIADHSDPTDIAAPADSSSPGVRFEALGSSSSLLSVSLSASQTLKTRRGTLVGVSGNPEHAISTLSPLSPIRRAPLGIPWLFQRVISTSPLSLLIATKAAQTSFAVLNLDGRVDWMIAQRAGLVAWSGENLIIKPTIDTRFSLAHWGRTALRGRGLVALVGSGKVYRVTLNAGEQYVAHPSNILAYSLIAKSPRPFRFKTSALPLQIPNLGVVLPNLAFFHEMRQTRAFQAIAQALFAVRTWTRRIIWGDRLFMRFEGPTTVLLQSRGSRLRDALTNRDVNEIADTPAGALQDAEALKVTSERTPTTDMASSNPQVPQAKLAQASANASRKSPSIEV